MSTRSIALSILLCTCVAVASAQAVVAPPEGARPSASAAGAALAGELAAVQRLHAEGRTADALARAERWLAQAPRDAQMRFQKSILLADSNRAAEAMALLEQLAQDYPELAEPHNNLAALHAAAGDYEKARAALAETLRLNPGYAAAHENLGDVYTRLAEQSYARAHRLEPASRSLPSKLKLVRDLASSTLSTETRNR